MLIGEIFDEFIHVIHENQKYTIGLINEEKEITLCSDKSMIGTRLDYNHPDKNNVYFEISVQSQDFGYLWVNGDADSLQMIGNLLYESLTIRLMFEINQKNLKRKVTKDDELIRCLLNEEKFDMAQVLEMDFMNFYFYIGTIQHKMRQYAKSYQSCLWLKDHIKAKLNSPVFFTDYLTEYFLTKIDAKDVESVYNYYMETGQEIDFRELIEISEALMNNDFNLTQTAEDLFLHKNTLIYKIKKYEEIFQIDIRGSFHGKILLLLISRALNERSTMAQVGD